MESGDSDFIDSDTEAYLYSQIHHSYQPLSECQDDNKTEDENVMTVNAFQNGAETLVSGTTNSTVEQTVHVLNTNTRVRSYQPPFERNINNNIKRKSVTTFNAFQKKATSETLVPGTSSFLVVNSNRHSFRISRTIKNDFYNSEPVTISETYQQDFPNVNREKFTTVNNTVTKTTGNCSISSAALVSSQDSLSKPSVTVLSDEDLIPERQNRTHPQAETVISTPKRANKKRKLVARNESVDESSDSSEEEVTGWLQSENHQVVINVGNSSDRTCYLKHKEEHDEALWEISQEDRQRDQRNKDKMMYIECFNCRERGHLSKHCKKSKKLMNCFLCGQPGHRGEKCVNPVCNTCLLPGHWHYQCRWSPAQAPPCPICQTRGHLCQQCPSLWRRYHLTTTQGPVVTCSDSAYRYEKKSCSCYNCGQEGHYAFNCSKSKRKTLIVPANRIVLDYRDHRKTLLNPANIKLWRRKLKLASMTYVQDNAEDVSLPAKKQKKMRPSRTEKRNINKKKKVWAHGGGDIVRIDPITESSFPRTKKKIRKQQNVQGLSASFLKFARKKISKKKKLIYNTRDF